MAGRPRPVLVHSGLFMQGGAAPARKLLIALWSNAAEVRKQLPLRLFMLKTIILPRQARDKHRESTQIKGCVLSQCLVRMARALPLDRQVRRLKQTLAGDMYDPATGRTWYPAGCRLPKLHTKIYSRLLGQAHDAAIHATMSCTADPMSTVKPRIKRAKINALRNGHDCNAQHAKTAQTGGALMTPVQNLRQIRNFVEAAIDLSPEEKHTFQTQCDVETKRLNRASKKMIEMASDHKGKKNSTFCAIYIHKNDDFAKTCLGQT